MTGSTLRFDTLRVAVVWHFERPAVPWPLNKQEIIKLRRESTEPICERPVTYYPSSELGENASTRRADVAAALLDWLDDLGVRREWLRAEDPQSEKSVAERDRLVDKRYLDKDDLEFILAKIRELDTDKDPTEQLDDFLVHMLERCPWLEHEWPGATTSASEVKPSSQDAGATSEAKPLSEGYRRVKFYSDATKGVLTSDVLDHARRDGRLVRSKKPRGRWFELISEVVGVWPEHRKNIDAAKHDETRRNTMKPAM